MKLSGLVENVLRLTAELHKADGCRNYNAARFIQSQLDVARPLLAAMIARADAAVKECELRKHYALCLGDKSEIEKRLKHAILKHISAEEAVRKLEEAT